MKGGINNKVLNLHQRLDFWEAWKVLKMKHRRTHSARSGQGLNVSIPSMFLPYPIAAENSGRGFDNLPLWQNFWLPVNGNECTTKTRP